MQTFWVTHPQLARTRRRLLLAACLLGVSVLTLVAALLAAQQHWVQHLGGPFAAPSAVVMLLLTVLQWRGAWVLIHGSRFDDGRWVAWGRFIVRWQLAGTVLAYIVALGLPPTRDVLYAFLTIVAAWYTIGLWSWVADRKRFDGLRHLLASRAVQRIARACYRTAVLLVVLETGLRGYAFLADDRTPIAQAAHSLRLVPGSQFQGRTVNQLGYWDDEFGYHVPPGVFRVAVLGGQSTLGGTAESNYLAQVERDVPGIEVCNFGVAQTGPREHVAQLVHEVAFYRPDLVLVCLAVDESITARVPLPGRFDWRSLRLGQLAGGWLGHSRSWLDPQQLLEPPSDYEEYLSRRASRLTLCRTPLDDGMRESWEETFLHLNDLVTQCARRDLSLAVVFVPGDFQVNRQLCQQLQRRAGLEPRQLDLDLPQRRLRSFADERNVPWLDLLPHLRSTAELPYERDAATFNETGNRVAAEVLGQWLRKQFGTQIDASIQVATH